MWHQYSTHRFLVDNTSGKGVVLLKKIVEESVPIGGTVTDSSKTSRGEGLTIH